MSDSVVVVVVVVVVGTSNLGQPTYSLVQSLIDLTDRQTDRHVLTWCHRLATVSGQVVDAMPLTDRASAEMNTEDKQKVMQTVEPSQQII